MRERKSLPAEWVNLLPRDYMRKWYEEYYSCCVYCNAAGLGQRFMHRSIEHRHDTSRNYKRVLEIGANHGEHLQYVQHTFNEYFLTDIETFDRSVLPPSEKRPGLIFQSEDACKLSFPDNHFDRVLCSCVLHHVIDAEAALTELR